MHRGAWTWKVVRPEGPHLRLSDVEYAIAARMNLGLQPFPPLARTMLPSNCPLCKSRVQLDNDPWHWLTCAHMRNGELTRRHDAVVEAISRVARQVGAQVRTEVTGAEPVQRSAARLTDRLPWQDVAVGRVGVPTHSHQLGWRHSDLRPAHGRARRRASTRAWPRGWVRSC